MTTMYDVKLPHQGIIRPIRQDLNSFHPTKDHSKSKPGSTLNYLSIPFAQPPIGNLRWKPPNGPAPSWDQIRQSKIGKSPLQSKGSLPLRDRQNLEFSEDCLYINVFKPLNIDQIQEEKLPVMVWVYGGAFVTGSIHKPLYDFSRLANETQSIIVSISYRLNIFGFLGSRSLSSEDPGSNPLPEAMWKKESLKRLYSEGSDTGIGSGNYGIWDVLAGLEWVQKNVAHFGGDSNNITLFGESAGAILIDYLLKIPKELLPSDFTLFHKVILQSGSVWTVLPRSLESAQATFDKLLEKSGCKDLKELREKDGNELREIVGNFPSIRPRTEYDYYSKENESEILSTSNELKLRCDLSSDSRKFQEMSLLGPVWDGVLIPKDFRARISDGNELKKDGEFYNDLGKKGCMIGYCIDEGSMFNPQVNDVEKLLDQVNRLHPDLKEDIKRLYGVDEVQDPLSAFYICAAYTGDMLFQSPTQYLMKHYSNSSIPTYGYVQAHKPSKDFLSSMSSAPDLLAKLGCFHASEMSFLFGLDGTEDHQFEDPQTHYEKRKDLEREFQIEKNKNEKVLGFRDNEKEMSLEMMKIWKEFAYGLKEPFQSLNVTNNENPSDVVSPSDLIIKAFSNCPQLGSFSSESLKALKKDADSTTDLRGDLIKLKELTAWKEKVGDCQDMEEKFKYWMSNSGEHIWESYYGDKRLNWEP